MSILSKFVAVFRGSGGTKPAINPDRTLEPGLAVTFSAAAHGIPTVRFDSKLVTETVKADLRDNISKIKKFKAVHFDHIYSVALESISSGGNLLILCDAIMALNIPDITREHAGDISRNLNRKAKALITRERQLSIGILHAIWRYSGAPCCANRKKPSTKDIRQDAAHKAADGKRYEVAKGMLLNGRYKWPGQDPACKCVSMSIIPGLDAG